MKKFLVRIIIYFAILAIMDISVGAVFRHLRTSAKGGDTYRRDYIAYRIDAPVLIFGSSRAIHHYDPRILKDSLKSEVYNCGLEGNGILYTYGEYQLIRNRYKPKMVIIDVISVFDIFEGAPNERYLRALKWYSETPGVSNLFDDISKKERYKLWSEMWKYNTVFVQIASDNVRPQQSNILGYKPLDGVMKANDKKRRTYTDKVDTLKLTYWDKLLRQLNDDGVKVVLMVSPVYGGADDNEYKSVKELSYKYGIPFISYLNNPEYITKMGWFEDSQHMNHIGAEKYSKEVAHLLDSIMQ